MSDILKHQIRCCQIGDERTLAFEPLLSSILMESTTKDFHFNSVLINKLRFFGKHHPFHKD
jgi:hypothetical protein